MNPEYSCEHYWRNCQIQAPCCKIYYRCKLCHDDQYQGPKAPGCKVQRMEFDKVEKVRCLKCALQQQPAEACANPECEVKFGEYTCLKCKLFENNPNKVNDIFHCDDCRMCRRGKRQNFFHCGPCGYCRPICERNNHKCTDDLVDSNCPICMENLNALPCGHLIHVDCLSMYNNINCPICGMAIQKMNSSQNSYIQKIINETKDQIPEQLKNKKVSVLCNQCLHKTMEADFHFYGIKCEKCGTYNTKMI